MPPVLASAVVVAVAVGLALALALAVAVALGATLEAADMVTAAAPAVEVGLAVADAVAEAEAEASPVEVCAAAAETNSATNSALRPKNNDTLLTLSTPFARTSPYGSIVAQCKTRVNRPPLEALFAQVPGRGVLGSSPRKMAVGP